MKYIISVLGVVVLAVVAFTLLLGDSSPEQAPEGTTRVDVTEYVGTDVATVYTVNGNIVGEEERRAIRISVSRDERVIEILKGYNGTVIAARTFANNDAAYDEFLHALAVAGFGLPQESLYDDEKGVCPRGNITTYQLKDGSDELLKLWSSSCGRKEGSFGGNSTTIRRLFEAQIPEYRDFARNVDL